MGAYRKRRERSSVVSDFWWVVRRVDQIVCVERMMRVRSMRMSMAVAVIQKGSCFSVRLGGHGNRKGLRTIGIHCPVQISHGRGMLHSNTIPVITASVHTTTKIPTNITPTLCNVLSANRWRNMMIEHLDILRASTKRMVDTKTLI